MRIRLKTADSSVCGKLLIVSKDITLKALIQKAVVKLGMSQQLDGTPLRKLYLEGKYVVESVKEIRDDDEIVVVHDESSTSASRPSSSLAYLPSSRCTGSASIADGSDDFSTSSHKESQRTSISSPEVIEILDDDYVLPSLQPRCVVSADVVTSSVKDPKIGKTKPVEKESLRPISCIGQTHHGTSTVFCRDTTQQKLPSARVVTSSVNNQKIGKTKLVEKESLQPISCTSQSHYGTSIDQDNGSIVADPPGEKVVWVEGDLLDKDKDSSRNYDDQKNIIKHEVGAKSSIDEKKDERNECPVEESWSDEYSEGSGEDHGLKHKSYENVKPVAKENLQPISCNGWTQYGTSIDQDDDSIEVDASGGKVFYQEVTKQKLIEEDQQGKDKKSSNDRPNNDQTNTFNNESGGKKENEYSECPKEETWSDEHSKDHGRNLKSQADYSIKPTKCNDDSDESDKESSDDDDNDKCTKTDLVQYLETDNCAKKKYPSKLVPEQCDESVVESSREEWESSDDIDQEQESSMQSSGDEDEHYSDKMDGRSNGNNEDDEKYNRESCTYTSDEKDDYSDDGDEDYDPDSDDSANAQKATKKRRKLDDEVPLKFVINTDDLPMAPGMNARDMPEVHGAIKEKITKLLNTGLNKGATESEARNAMRLAQKLLKQHNLSQALLLREQEEKDSIESESNGLKGGLVRVKLKSRTGNAVIMHRWLHKLEEAVGISFEVSYYFTCCRYRRSFTFYGIYMNCQLAAYAFAKAAERIFRMMAEYKVENENWCAATKNSVRLCYAHGITTGLLDQAELEQELEEERRQQMQSRMNSAAIILRDHRQKVERKVLNDFNISLSCGPDANEINISFGGAFNQGKIDSKKINLKQRAIGEF